MKQTTISQEIFIDRPPARVFEFLSDQMNSRLIHPLIIDMTLTGEEGDGTRHYRITDQLEMGPLRFKIKYEADHRTEPPDTIISIGRQSPRVTVHNTTRCRPEGTGTRLVESLVISAPNLLFNYTVKQAAASHELMLARLKAYLEGE